MREFHIPACFIEVEQEIKKSRFITQIAHTNGHQQVSQFVAQVRAEHPQARHHCWACVCSAPGDPHGSGFSDDGEPSGTAGKPMLAHLVGSGLGQLTAVVIRYFGGIKLGTGGLVKAYGSSVGQALEQLETKLYVPLASIEFSYRYELQAIVELLIKRFNVKILHSEYLDKVFVCVEIALSEQVLFIESLKDLSKNQIEIKNQSP